MYARAPTVAWTREAERALTQIETLGFGRLPLCIARPRKSLSATTPLGHRPARGLRDHRPATCCSRRAPATWCPLLGDIMRMPGLPTSPQAERMTW